MNLKQDAPGKDCCIMERIASFCVDHTKLDKGMYLSNPALHTIEHLFATYARNSAFSKNIIYVGPMGCRTGFYLLTKDLAHADAIELVRRSMEFIADFSGTIPGSTAIECGNYQEHDLDAAKEAAVEMAALLQGWTPENLHYNQ